MKTIVVILAGGIGNRFGMLKQFVPINKKPVLLHTVEKFEGFERVVTVPEKFKDIANNIVKEINDIEIIKGGNTRQQSVKNALNFIKSKKEKYDNVIITDANRPLIHKAHIEKGLKLLKKYDCVVSVCKSINTSCIKDKQYKVLPRKNMYDLLMPQFFKFNLIYKAHKETKQRNATDDSQLLEDAKIGFLEISFWEGLKLTRPQDYAIFELLLKGGRK